MRFRFEEELTRVPGGIQVAGEGVVRLVTRLIEYTQVSPGCRVRLV